MFFVGAISFVNAVSWVSKPFPGVLLYADPLVSIWVVAYVIGPDGNGVYTLSFKFSGCCADCFERNCKVNKVSIGWTDMLNILPESIEEYDVRDYNM